jgi:hypothetical protein
VSEQRLALYTKQQQQALSDEKCVELIQKETKKILPTSNMFDLMSPLSTKEDALQDMLDMLAKLTRIRNHMIDYDFGDIMNIVIQDDSMPMTVSSQHNLFNDYMSLTPEMVAKSNKWYLKYVDMSTPPWIPQNLQMNVEFFENNMSEDLWQAVQQMYKDYPVAQQGGPLVFILMMHKLQKNNDMCLKNLAKCTETLDIHIGRSDMNEGRMLKESHTYKKRPT